ncbi:hypothetical protein G9A89_014895 [Geosiphon pyriformis]|nr:hypothetical protein G9A89_014895 [Geosiphon pyriformis]
MSAKYISKATSGLCTYLMKVLHRRLSVIVRKYLYNHSYPSILCMCCGEMDFSDHSFVCGLNFLTHQGLLSGVAHLLRIGRGYVTNLGLSIGHLFFANTIGKIMVDIVV